MANLELQNTAVEGVQVRADILEQYGQDVFTPEALEFVAQMQRQFGDRIAGLREYRDQRQAMVDQRIAAGNELPMDLMYELDGLSTERRDDSKIINDAFDTQRVSRSAIAEHMKRDGDVVMVSPANLAPKAIAGLGNKAQHMLFDFEDAEVGTATATAMGVKNLKDFTAGRIEMESSRGTKVWERGEDHVMTVTPRLNGFGMAPAREVLVDGKPVDHIVLELALNHFHNAAKQAEQGIGPSYYIPKLRHAEGARLFKDMVDFADEAQGLKAGTTQAVIMIEELSMSYEMREAMFELSVTADERADVLARLAAGETVELQNASIAGANCGYWDYNASVVEQLANDARREFPGVAGLNASPRHIDAMQYALVANAETLGIAAEGGMVVNLYESDKTKSGRDEFNAGIDAIINTKKNAERERGFKGTWIALPQAYDAAYSGIHGERPSREEILANSPYADPKAYAAALIDVNKREKPFSWEEVQDLVRVPLEYGESWTRLQVGCSPIAHHGADVHPDVSDDTIIARLMEDVATSRRNLAILQYAAVNGGEVEMPDGTIRPFDQELVADAMDAVLTNIEASIEAGVLSKKSDKFSPLRYEDGAYPEVSAMVQEIFAKAQQVEITRFYTDPMKDLLYKLEQGQNKSISPSGVANDDEPALDLDKSKGRA